MCARCYTWGLSWPRAPGSAPFRVVWSDLSPRLEAAPLAGRESRVLIPLNSCYVMPVRDGPTTLRLSAWLNSTWCRGVARATADPASGGYSRFNARVVSALPCPDAVVTDPDLLELGRQGANLTLSQETLDERCAELLSLTAAERVALARLAGSGARPGR